MSTNIPCVLMRGGTSRGPFFLADWLPRDPEARDRTLIAALGSPHELQIDGLGGGTAHGECGNQCADQLPLKTHV